MDVTPQLIEQIDFTDRRRGYDPDEVDDFLEKVGATIASLQAQVAELSGRATRAEAEVVALRDQQQAAAAQPQPMSDEDEVEQATRTLVLAKRTAEAAISEARQEAAKLISDARARAEAETTEATTEADRLVGEAHAQREELLRLAREEADSEKVAQRDRLAADIAGLERRRDDLSSDIGRLEGRMEEYRGALEQVHGAIRRVLDDPDALKAKPPLDLADTGGSTGSASSAFYYTGSNPVVSGAESIPLASGLGDTASQPAVAPDRVGADEVAVLGATDGGGTEADATGGTDAEGSDGPGATTTAPGDPWSPGSWSEVSSALEGSPSEDATLFDDPVPAASDASPFDAGAEDGFEPADPGDERVVLPNVDAPTEAYTDLSQDRYLRDLDAAVNRTEADDRAMSQFFDSSDAGGGRRFGRRR